MSLLYIVLSLILFFLLIIYLKKNLSPFALLRVFGVFLSLLLITNPIGRWQFLKRPKEIILLWDFSKSMMGKKGEAAKKFAEEFLRERKEVSVFAFAETVLPLNRRPELTGERTDLSKALSFAQGKRPGAILLLSDGLHNGSQDPVAIAKKKGPPIYSVLTGREEERDLAITDCIYPEVINEGESLYLKVITKAKNLPGKRDLILFSEEGRILEKRNLSFREGEYHKEEVFTLLPPKETRYSLFLESVPGEEDYQNNRYQLTVAVRQRRKKIYYLSNSPTFNLRFLSQLLLPNKENEVQFVISLDGKVFYLMGEKRRVAEGGAQPLKVDFSIFPNDAILIMDNLRTSLLTQEAKRQLKELAIPGRGVIFLGGGEDYQEIGDFLPLTSEGKVIEKEVAFEITPEMTESPLFSKGGEKLLTKAPPFFGLMKTRPKEKASVWWTSSEGPVLAFWRYKDKKVVQLTGFPLWRLFFGGEEEKGKDLFQNLLDFIQFGEKVFLLKTDKKTYYSGENIRVRVLALNEVGRALKNLDFRLVADKTEVPMAEIGEGLYEANLHLPSGEHTLKALGYENGEKIGETEEKVKVEEKSIELLRSGIDKELLSSLAELSGGQLLSSESVPKELRLAEYRDEIRFIPRSIPLLYLLTAALFILDWIWRKRKGLP